MEELDYKIEIEDTVKNKIWICTTLAEARKKTRLSLTALKNRLEGVHSKTSPHEASRYKIRKIEDGAGTEV